MQVGFEGMEIILSERERARMVKSLGQDCSASPGKGVCWGAGASKAGIYFPGVPFCV